MTLNTLVPPAMMTRSLSPWSILSVVSSRNLGSRVGNVCQSSWLEPGILGRMRYNLEVTCRQLAHACSSRSQIGCESPLESPQGHACSGLTRLRIKPRSPFDGSAALLALHKGAHTKSMTDDKPFIALCIAGGQTSPG